MFEQCIVFHNAVVQNIYNVFYLKMYIFKAVKNQSGIGFIVDALFGCFVYLHSLYTVVELHTNFVWIHFGRQPYIISHCNLSVRIMELASGLCVLISSMSERIPHGTYYTVESRF